MPKIVKLNYDRKVRYLYDKDTEECDRLAEQIIDHYGQFLETPHGWDMTSIAVYEKLLRNCGLSVNEFLAKTFTIALPKPKKKATVKKKPTVTKKKVPVKKPTVKKKPVVRKKPTAVTKKKVPVKKKTPIKKKPAKKVA
jgi:hypothetical protein